MVATTSLRLNKYLWIKCMASVNNDVILCKTEIINGVYTVLDNYYKQSVNYLIFDQYEFYIFIFFTHNVITLKRI